MGTNPAKRLHDLLSEARSLGNQPTHNVWRAVLKTKDGDNESFLHHYLSLNVLFRETVSAAEQLEGIDPDLHLSWVKPVATVLDIRNHQTDWERVKLNLPDTVIQALKFLAHELAKRHQEDPIAEEAIRTVLDEVEALGRTIVDSSLDVSIKSLITVHLENIRLALLAYRIRGAAALREAVSGAVGAVVLNQDLFRPVQKTPELKRFTKVLLRLNELVSLACKLKELAAPGFNALLGMASAVP